MVFRDPNRPVTSDMREPTIEETLDWLNGNVTGPKYVETEFGLMIRE